MVQDHNALTDVGGHMIAEGLKGNRSVTEIRLVSAGLLLARLLLLTSVEQENNDGMSDSVKREIMQGLQEGHGADNGVPVTSGSVFFFFDFETCEEIPLSAAYGRNVRLFLLHFVARRAMHPAARPPSTSSPPAADMQLTPHVATAGRRLCAAVRPPGAVQAPEEDQVGKQECV